MKKISSSKSGIYFRSSANNWDLSNEFMILNDGSYVAKNVTIQNGMNEFKIADANWSSNCNYGYSDSKPIMLYHNYVLNSDINSKNIVMWAHSDYTVDVFAKMTNNGLIIRMKTAKK